MDAKKYESELVNYLEEKEKKENRSWWSWRIFQFLLKIFVLVRMIVMTKYGLREGFFNGLQTFIDWLDLIFKSI